MSDHQPADAALLRFLADDIAHTFDCASQDDACICGAAHHAARLRALAAREEKDEHERQQRTARCQECGQPVRPMDPLRRYENV